MGEADTEETVGDLMKKLIKDPTDKSLSTPFWHDIHHCAVCLKVFLPEVFEERLQNIDQARAR